MNYIKENLESYIKEAYKNCRSEYYNSLKDLIENIKTIKHDKLLYAINYNTNEEAILLGCKEF